MKKQLPTNAITNELAGASAFFQSQATPLSEQAPEKPSAAEPVQASPKQPRKQAVKTSAMGDTTDARPNDTLIPRHHDTVTLPLIETVRKAVKKVGKEAATHRFTPEEKRELADIVYTYARRGYKTSENELARIGINWLVLDYKEQGEESVLAKALQALNR
jgi:hypothetical protein